MRGRGGGERGKWAAGEGRGRGGREDGRRVEGERRGERGWGLFGNWVMQLHEC